MNKLNEKKKVTLDDIRPPQYLSLKIGESVDIHIKEVLKESASEDFALHGQDYRYKIIAETGEVLSVGAWKLWNALQKVFNEKNQIEGLKLHISHLEKGVYNVEVIGQ